jgi:membrane protein DedA with SNARE-associated domain
VGVVGGFDHWLLDFISGSSWTYGVVLGLALLDAILPVVPSETAVITAGVVAAQGDLSIGLVLAAAAVGAFAGDNLTYWIGRQWGHRAAERFLRGEKGRRSLAWAEKTLNERGGLLIVVARFIPGGRIATMLTAGTVEYPYLRRFVPYDAIAAIFWACYAGLLGYFGGKAFQNSTWKALLVAFAIAAGIALAIEGIRRLNLHRRLVRLLGWESL